MEKSYAERLSTLPIRARVAFVVVLAETVLPLLKKETNLYQSVRAALNDAWDWLKGIPVSAQTLYDKHFDHLATLSCEQNTVAMESALNAAISAMYYLLWHAFTKELAKGTIEDSEVHDMSEGDEGLIDQVCQYVTQADSGRKCWVDQLANWAASTYVARDAEDLGIPVESGSFPPRDWQSSMTDEASGYCASNSKTQD